MLRARPDGSVDLDVQAVPRASRNAIGKPHGDRLKLHVSAPPVDGEANAAIIKLVAKTLALPRAAVEIVRGQTGKRKTLRIHGLEAGEIEARLGLAPREGHRGPALLALSLTLASATACENARELPITVILPEDTTDLERADNASLLLQPSGDVFTYSVDGLDFALELEDEPSASLQRVELYLADGEELLAWGSTAEFSTAGADLGLALFLGRPGRLSTWPNAVEVPDPDLLASPALGRGMLLVETDGNTYLLNHYTLELEAGARLPDSVGFPPDDGGLFPAADGAVIRLAYEAQAPAAWRYEPAEDRWTELEVDGADAIGPRPGAAVLVDPDFTRLYLLGGGDLSDGAAIDLQPDEGDRLAAAPVADLELDRARPGATALWLPRGDNPSADALIVGGGTEAGPLAVRSSDGVGVGPELWWTDPACAIERSDPEGSLTAPDPEATLTVLCLGGLLDDQATPDAVRITVGADGPATVELSESFLPTALGDPLLLEDDFALYAQGAGRLVRIDRSDGSLSEPDSSALRAYGGHSVSLVSGATFLVGGFGTDDAALDRWQVFTPAIEP